MLMLGPKKILVVGDVILDISYKGKVNRVSPEAPIPALLYEEMEYSLGGAANLTSNLIAAGQDATLVSIIGSDKYENTLTLDHIFCFYIRHLFSSFLSVF